MTIAPVVRRAAAYTWSWDPDGDRFTITDPADRAIVGAAMQPVLEFASGDLSECVVQAVDDDAGRLTVEYGNGDGLRMVVSWRFEDAACWLDPVRVVDPLARPLRSMHLFAGSGAVPALACTYLVQPGISASPGVGPVVDSHAVLSFASWVGRGSGMDDTVQHQQWALPVHYLAGHSLHGWPNQRDALREKLSHAFCAGLADLPAADLRLVSRAGRYSVVFDYREDLWGPADAGSDVRGSTWCWSFAGHYRDAIAGYYQALVRSGVVAIAQPNARKLQVMAAAQYNTWGAQAGSGRQWNLFDQESLDNIWSELNASGLRPQCFVIDDKWEHSYGPLEHCEDRFPDFEKRLRDIRAAGCFVGLWTAFLRCENPAEVGLGPEHMLHGPDGSPVVKGGRDGRYYLYDVTQPVVADTLRELARRFARRYRPDLVKFDFGYELPSLSIAAPKDPRWGGERLLKLALEIVMGAVREEVPDVVVMYYHLSPLFGDHIDLHSIDDVWLAGEEYHEESNRRLYFSSLLGELGMPSYGSGGYDWPSMAEIWFDTVATGSIGSLGSFTGDPIGSRPSRRDIAKYNGLAQLVRRSAVFRVEPLRAPRIGASTAARSSSWARLEDSLPTLVALRPRHFNGSGGVTEYGGVDTTAQVVVAAGGDGGIVGASELRIVPYDAGRLRITRAVSGQAHIVTHLDDGSAVERRQPIDGRILVVDLAEQAGSAQVEWVQVRFSDDAE
ncbi:hypothetical protein ACXJJ3_16565 [Kribbella sp. WER1]